MAKFLALVFFFVVFVVVLGAVCSLIGLLISWLFTFFGLTVPWYACAALWFLIISVARAIGGSK